MRPNPAVVVIFLVVGGLILLRGVELSWAEAPEVRHPVRAGSFYPADPAELRGLIADLSQQARAPEATLPAPTTLRALILPHAGYIYSGPVAAYASLVLSAGQFKKVLLLGPDHFVGLKSAALPEARAFETPLGRVAVHPSARRLLARPEIFQPLSTAEDREHSLEVELPFLQFYLREFELVPVVVGRADAGALAAALEAVLDPETLVVVSSDLSHYLPYAVAVQRDRETIAAILALDGRPLAADENRACGATAIRVLLNFAGRRGWRTVLLNYRNSGDTAGDRARVVGYAAIAFYGDPSMPDSHATPSMHLEPRQGQALVKLARKTLLERFGRRLPSSEADRLQADLSDSIFASPCGTFVTLKLRGQLRGCIGSLGPSEPLAQSVADNSINAAFHDPRFSVLSEAELDQVDIEVSVLTEPRPLPYTHGAELLQKLRPGVDGVILRKGHASATFLPQVWQQLPRPEDFLNHLCLKAGLARDTWKHTPLEVSTYQVQYFEEKP